MVRLRDARPGDEILVEGEISRKDVVIRRRRALLVEISDGSGYLLLRFFHFSSAQVHALSPGVRIRCFGEIRQGPSSLEMVHPEYRSAEDASITAADRSLTPVYPATEGLHQTGLRRMTDQALVWMSNHPQALRDVLLATDCLPGGFDMSLRESLECLHRPSPKQSEDDPRRNDHPARLRLAFEELVAHQLSLVELRRRAHRRRAPAVSPGGGIWERIEEAIPFQLTGAQRRVVREIRKDLEAAQPMLRLLQGDVGSGKTLVALAACVAVAESGLQAVLMAPTDLLAEQHLRSFTNWLIPVGLTVDAIRGRQTASERNAVLERVASGETRIVVGTHALYQDLVEFRDLGLVVIDEQHRFGVHQRLALADKGRFGDLIPHQLIMTATPIPRTLAMTAYADLDYSVLDELPPGREPVSTVAIAETRRAEVIARIAKACGEGRQAYWVCTLIEDSEALQCQAAEAAAALLDRLLPALSVGLVHGRMSAEDKDRVMAGFRRRTYDVLVATTVIEVGLDVPNASLMVIENAERLGLAQLHQLRGRVGRGAIRSSCVLMYRPPLSQNARRRLDVMRRSNDGFEIAREDLELRGPGEVLGTRQTGVLRFRVADLLRDGDLLPDVQRAARDLVTRCPEDAQRLLQRWVGDDLRFGEVG